MNSSFPFVIDFMRKCIAYYCNTVANLLLNKNYTPKAGAVFPP